MNGLYFKAWNGTHYISLAEILRAIEDGVRDLTWSWRIKEVALGDSISNLESLHPNGPVKTHELLHAVSPCPQIIDGEIDGLDADGRPALRVRAVDSTWWDVETDAPDILVRILEMFPDAAPIPAQLTTSVAAVGLGGAPGRDPGDVSAANMNVAMSTGARPFRAVSA